MVHLPGRYLEALQKGKAPKVIKNATYKYIDPKIKKEILRKNLLKDLNNYKGGNYLPKLRELTKKTKNIFINYMIHKINVF